MKQKLQEELNRQKEIMLFLEQGQLGQQLAQGLSQAIKSGIGKSLLDLTFGDDIDVDMNMDSTTPTSTDTTPLTTKTNDDEFYKSVLKGIGAPVTDENMKFMYAWRQAEGGKAKNNPFNTTQSKPNSTFYNCLKKSGLGCSSGVRNYMTPQDGIDATIKTLKNGRYGNIINSLKSGSSAEQSAMALKSSPWGTGQLALKVVKGYNSGSSPKPPKIA